MADTEACQTKARGRLGLADQSVTGRERRRKSNPLSATRLLSHHLATSFKRFARIASLVLATLAVVILVWVVQPQRRVSIPGYAAVDACSGPWSNSPPQQTERLTV